MHFVVGSYEGYVGMYQVERDEDGSFSYSTRYLKVSPTSEDGGYVSCLTAGKSFVAASSSDSSVSVYNLSTDEEVAHFEESEESVDCIFMPDDKHIVGAGKDGLIRVWEMKQKGNLIFTFKGYSGPISSMAIHPSGKLCLSVHPKEFKVFTWNMISGRLAYKKDFSKLKPEQVRFTQSGNHFILASKSCLHVFDVSNAVESVKDISMSSSILAFEVLHNDDKSKVDKNIVVVGDNKGFVYFINALTGETILSFQAHENRVKGIHSLISKELSDEEDDLFISTVSSDKNLKIWKLSKKGVFGDDKQQKPEENLVLTIETELRLTCVTSWTKST